MPMGSSFTTRARRSASAYLILLTALALMTVLLAGLAACGSASTSGASPGDPTASSATATADAAINWQTATEISGSSTSQGGGTNQDTSESSTTVSGAYRVIAACQGSGSLNITLKPGGSSALPCTPAQQDLVRIAGSDTAPADGTLDITVDRQGEIEWSDVRVQIRM